MGKGKRIRNARERPEKKISHGLTTDNYRLLKWTSMLTLGTGIFTAMFNDVAGMSSTAQHILKSIGYISVPLYSFLEVKAFHHTENKWKHFLKIFLLGLASVIPFSMMVSGNPFTIEKQNACLTALIGFLCLWIADRNFRKPFEKYIHSRKFLNLISFSVNGIIAGTGVITASFLKAENGLYAMPMLMIMNGAENCRHKKLVQAIALLAWCGQMMLSKNYYALSALLSLIPIWILQDRDSVFQMKDGKANHFLEVFEMIFYPACLWGMGIAKTIMLMM
jgi:hypothetical protein